MSSRFDPALNDLAQRFRRFADNAGTSPLYQKLALKIAADPAVLSVASQAASSPSTVLLFAAVHFLLEQGARHSLLLYYPDLVPERRPADDPYPAFQSFCLTHEASIIDILKSRRVQTNEVCRCSYISLGLSVMARERGPYALIDVGSSAGLHLLWAHCGYNYEGVRLGRLSSLVQLKCRFEGLMRPKLEAWIEPVEQTGIDLTPLDPCDPEDQAWLRALIWPEHFERRELLDRALCLAQSHRPHVVAGDAFQALPKLVGEIPRDRAFVFVTITYLINFRTATGCASTKCSAAFLATAISTGWPRNGSARRKLNSR